MGISLGEELQSSQVFCVIRATELPQNFLALECNSVSVGNAAKKKKSNNQWDQNWALRLFQQRAAEAGAEKANP